MNIDCFIMNPPYNTAGSTIQNQITKIIKKYKPKAYIQICPFATQITYKTIEWVGDVFGIGFEHIFIFDMNGNNNDYVSKTKPQFMDSPKKYRLMGSTHTFLYVKEESPPSHVGISITEDLFDFLDKVNKSKIGNEIRKYFFTADIRKPVLYKLYELYKENKLIEDKFWKEKYIKWKENTKVEMVNESNLFYNG